MSSHMSLVPGIQKALAAVFLLIVLISCSGQEDKMQQQFRRLTKVRTAQEISEAKQYVVDSLDFVQPDTTDMRGSYISAWAGLYRGNVAGLVADSKKVVDRLAEESPQSVPGFIEIIVKSEVLADRPDAAASVAAYPYGINVAANEHSEIAARLLIKTKLPGSNPPAIEGVPHIREKTIVLFYESGCSNCDNLVERLIAGYSKLRDKGYDVITIAGDIDRGRYQLTAGRFPWLYKVCDFKGFGSPVFQRWGVAATPTMYLVNAEGTVESLKTTDNLIKDLEPV